MIRYLDSRFVYFVSAIIFKLALEGVYLAFVTQHFSYSGFITSFSYVKYTESWVLYLMLVSLMPRLIGRPSDFLLTLLMTGLLAPLLVLYGLADKSRFALYVVILGAILILVISRGRPFKIRSIKQGRYFAVVGMLFLSVTVTIWYIISGGLAYFNLDLTQVYNYRHEVGEVIGGSVISYLNSWASKVAGPVLLAVALWRKWYILAVLVSLLHVFWFGVSSHKSVLFYPLLVLFVWYWIRRTRAVSIIYASMSVVVGLAYLTYVFSGDIYAASMFIRRVFFVIALNTFDYYQFFGSNPKIFWSNSVTTVFTTYPYHVSPADLLGQWRGTGAHVNNSFLSTGYMHAGVVGVVAYSCIAGLIFRIYDSITYKAIPLWLGIAAIIVPSRALILSGDLLTSLLTHGVILAMFILFLLSNGWNETAVSRL